MKPLPEGPRRHRNASQPSLIRYYLIVYNLLSALGWSYVFLTTAAHLSGVTAVSRVMAVPPSYTKTSALLRLWSSIPLLKSSASISGPTRVRMPPVLAPLFNRASTLFIAVGPQTALVQTFAALEIVHSLLRWVRSPLVTNCIQVTSRLILVWGIAENYESARSNPMYASMVVAWSVTEIIRYSLYACNLWHYEPRYLLWLRYNTFFVLYPLGAGSEAALIFSTLPSSIPPRTGPWIQRTWRGLWMQKSWGGWDYMRAVLFLIWWPGAQIIRVFVRFSQPFTGLYVMYTYMIQQRGKVLRSGRLGELKQKAT